MLIINLTPYFKEISEIIISFRLQMSLKKKKAKVSPVESYGLSIYKGFFFIKHKYINEPQIDRLLVYLSKYSLFSKCYMIRKK